MRVPNSRRDREVRADQAMTPMIDVVFLLLIFFVCASVGNLKESLMSLDLSAGSVSSADVTPAPPQPKPVWVTELRLKLLRDNGNTVVLMQQPEQQQPRKFTSLDVLGKSLRDFAAFSPESPVILDIAPDIPAGDLIKVDDACRAAKFKKIQYAVSAGDIKPGKSVDRR